VIFPYVVLDFQLDYITYYVQFKLALICENTPERQNSDVRESPGKPSFLGNGLLNPNAYTRMKKILMVVFPVLSTSYYAWKLLSTAAA
jgi:hypothetical protein